MKFIPIFSYANDHQVMFAEMLSTTAKEYYDLNEATYVHSEYETAFEHFCSHLGDYATPTISIKFDKDNVIVKLTWYARECNFEQIKDRLTTYFKMELWRTSPDQEFQCPWCKE